MAAVTLSGGCQWPWQGEGDAGRIELSGTVEARETNLAFRVGGQIAHLHVDEGERIEAGQLVAELERRDYELAVARAQARERQAAARLDELRSGSRPQEIEVAEAAVARAQAELRFAKAEVARLRRLVPRQHASEEQLDQAERQAQVARAGLAEARERLDLVREGPRTEAIEQAAAERQAAAVEVEVARRELGYTRLESPVTGTVSVRRAEAGEVVTAAQPVLELAELEHPWVRAYLPEPDLARVRVGQPAQVRVDGRPGERFTGRLAFIAPDAEFTPKTVETQALRVDLVYRVKVRVENPRGLLKVGMPADVYLEPVK